MDNPETTDVEEALTNDGIVYPGSGWGFKDGIADNERRGMSHFVYYNNSGNPINGEPVVPVHYYNYMQSIWKNGQHMWYGGDGVSAATGAVVDLEANFMFGGETDPYFYGTGGVPTGPEGWTEVTAGNPPADRRFIMSAGPVTLEAGARNDFTMAALWARDESGSGMSVELLQAASDEVQALFDSCLVDQTTEVATLPEAERLTLTLFPNPSTDRLTLDVPTNICLERAEVFNHSGQRVHVSHSPRTGIPNDGCLAFAQWRLPNGRALLGPHARREVHGRAVIQISHVGIWNPQVVVGCGSVVGHFHEGPQGHGRRWWTRSA